MRSPAASRLPWAKVNAPPLSQPSVEEIARVASGELEMAYSEYQKFTSAVDSGPALATDLGLFHGASNVSEWTSSISRTRSSSEVFKGASWTESPSFYDLTGCWTMPEGSRSMRIGFRCARSAREPLKEGENS